MSLGPGFLSDNASPASPEVLEALARANEGPAAAYGRDPWSARVVELLKGIFGADAAVHLTFGGTGGNLLALRALVDRVGAVLCAETAHLACDEAAGPELVGGCKVIPVPHREGRIDLRELEQRIPEPMGPHRVPGRVVSISQPTELGTVYRPEELRELGQLARERGLALHVDGARLPLAAAALGVGLAEAAGPADVVVLGGTKLGLLGAEAVVFRDPGAARDLGLHQKQIGQLASKHRFLAAQILALYEGDLWHRLAARTLASAGRLRDLVAARRELEIVFPVETNAVFARVPAERLDAVLEHAPGGLWSRRDRLVRWMTGWQTSAADLEAFAAGLDAAGVS